MKISCEMIQDILPLYVEGIASEASTELVNEHIKECDCCKNYMGRLKRDNVVKNQDTPEKIPFEIIKKELSKRRKKTARIVVWGMVLIFLLTFFHITRPNYFSLEESSVKVGVVAHYPMVQFSHKVTGYEVTRVTRNGIEELEIRCWDSVWDRMMNKTVEPIILEPEDLQKNIYYIDYSKSYNRIPVHKYDVEHIDEWLMPDFTVKTVVKYVAAIVAISGWICGFLQQKGKKTFAKKIARILFLASGSYVISNYLFVLTEYRSYNVASELIMIILGAIAIFNLLLGLIDFVRQIRQDGNEVGFINQTRTIRIGVMILLFVCTWKFIVEVLIGNIPYWESGLYSILCTALWIGAVVGTAYNGAENSKWIVKEIFSKEK